MTTKTYAVFTNDVGPERYSRFGDVKGDTRQQAIARAKTLLRPAPGLRLLVLTETQKAIWPDSKTGAVSPSTEKKAVPHVL
jgi:hypothetical protein